MNSKKPGFQNISENFESQFETKYQGKLSKTEHNSLQNSVKVFNNYKI